MKGAEDPSFPPLLINQWILNAFEELTDNTCSARLAPPPQGCSRDGFPLPIVQKSFIFFIFIKPKMAILSGNRARAEAGWNSCLNQAFHYHGCPCAGGSGSCIYFFYYLFTHSPSFHAAIPKTRHLIGFSVCRKSDQLASSTAVKRGISPSNEKIVHSGQGTYQWSS